jgi:spermidine synthase
MSEPRWIDENLHHASVSQRLLAQRVLLEKTDGLQHVLVFENPVFGRTLMLDGVVQTTERDEFIYHEMLVHPALLAHGAARRVLIVGGGDGGSLEETLKHPSVERATLVEIDASVIAASRTHLPSVSAGAFDDPRAEIVISCGFTFLRESTETFDVIIIDSTDPRGPGWRLFTTAFYTHCRERLSKGGILVTQAGVPFFQPDELIFVTARLRAVFGDVAAYMAAVPTYHGGAMAFAWASDDREKRLLPAAELERRFAAAAIATRYYAPDLHAAAFALPRFVRRLVDGEEAPQREPAP